ncbi:Rv2578c family radical SAM protein [Nocardia camponoti]|uniref:Radical SAM protein n=1 Tax=Nocardia camponoti TaxID=1616106 RepID=A0A917V4S0_9NOCA|nr:Rv2578c family radical SAM protein [Nocardia camponoti]GGK39650.1 radical SAM protein [Nocardia camponoti]
MRWQSQTLGVDDGAFPGLDRAGLVRSVRTPEFDGITFHEVLCKSALNKMPESSAMPFRWTINPMRGCSHACRYCFARGSHEYLELDAGRDFDSQIVVKTNVVEVLRRELARPSWKRETVALGTNTDPYQRAEGRYALMPGIISALGESGTPFSILTKGPLLRRDLSLLTDVAASGVGVSVAVSIAILDVALHRRIEPGTPTPAARLALVRSLADAGFDVHVMIAPIIPLLTDSDAHLEAIIAEVAAAGASTAMAFAMHLRGPTRGWFLNWLAAEEPKLVPRYRELYVRGGYVTPAYRDWLRTKVTPLLDHHGLRSSRSIGPPPAAVEAPDPTVAPQLTLFG